MKLARITKGTCEGMVGAIVTGESGAGVAIVDFMPIVRCRTCGRDTFLIVRASGQGWGMFDPDEYEVLCEWPGIASVFAEREETKSQLESWAYEQIRAAGLFDEDGDYGGMIGKSVMAIVRVFAGQGHSGLSAAIVRNVLHRLLAWKPIVPIRDEPDQWEDAAPGLLQHRQMSSVFKRDGVAYWAEGRVFQDKPDGAWYTSAGSSVPIDQFPWMPPDEPEKVRLWQREAEPKVGGDGVRCKDCDAFKPWNHFDRDGWGCCGARVVSAGDRWVHGDREAPDWCPKEEAND